MKWPPAYFFTWTCYGQRLHGDERGSVDRYHNRFGEPLVPPNEALRSLGLSTLSHAPTVLSTQMRGVVRDSLTERCDYTGATLISLSVRPTHVHLIVKAQEEPGKVMGGFKARATRALRDARLVSSSDHVWTDRGSKRWLFTPESLRRACEYVLLEQGAPDEFTVRGSLC